MKKLSILLAGVLVGALYTADASASLNAQLSSQIAGVASHANKKGNVDKAMQLIEAGANANTISSNNLTLLMALAYHGLVAQAQELLDLGASAGLKVKGKDALYYATQNATVPKNTQNRMKNLIKSYL